MLHKSRIRICNKLGLHARAAAKFVSRASEFASEITVLKDETKANGKSIMSMLMLAAGFGTELEIIAEGRDAEQALNSLVALIDNKFDEAQ